MLYADFEILKLAYVHIYTNLWNHKKGIENECL